MQYLKLILVLTICFSEVVFAGAILSEFEPNPQGVDLKTQRIEIFGEANSFYNDLTLVAVETDFDSNIGEINSLIMNISGEFNSFGISYFDVPDLENPSFILILLQGLPVFERDLDRDDDGLFEPNNWFDFVLDAVGVFDSHKDYHGSQKYFEQIGGTGLFYSGDEPKLVFRDLTDLSLFAINDPAGGWVYNEAGAPIRLNEFDISPVENSFGSLNPTRVRSVNEPSSMYVTLLLWVFFCLMRSNYFAQN